jgi:hypothetical protein
MGVSTEDFDNCIVVVEVLREVLLEEGGLMIVRWVYGETIRRFLILEASVVVRDLDQPMVPSFSFLQIAQALSP